MQCAEGGHYAKPLRITDIGPVQAAEALTARGVL